MARAACVCPPQVFDFTPDMASFKALVQSTRAFNVTNCDYPEDVMTGLEAVSSGRLSWSTSPQATRVVLHIADAPAHGNAYHDSSIRDCCPSGDKYGRTAGPILAKWRRDVGVQAYHFRHVNPHHLLSDTRPVIKACTASDLYCMCGPCLDTKAGTAAPGHVDRKLAGAAIQDAQTAAASS